MAVAKKIPIATRSMGAEEQTPTVAELADWIGGAHGFAGDLMSLLLERSLAPQKEIGMSSAGGRFYVPRLLASIEGIADGAIVGELGAIPEELIADADRCRRIRKGTYVTLPAPDLLGLADRYYGDPDEGTDALAMVYKSLMRSMRDAGIGGHVLIADDLRAEIAERFAGPRTFLFVEHPDRPTIELLLEAQQQVAVDPDQVEKVLGMVDEYEVQRLTVIDPDAGSLATAAEVLDRDRIVAGGYCRKSCKDYWADLAARAWVFKETPQS